MLIGCTERDQSTGIPRRHDASGCERAGICRAQRLVETDAGAAIGLTDDLYRAAGATMMETAEQLFAEADMIVKVKEPQPQECQQLRPDQILFTYLHLAADPKQAELLMASGATCIAYETVTSSQGGLPLLAPMSVVAGRLSVQAGAHHMEIHQGSNGTLLGGGARRGARQGTGDRRRHGRQQRHPRRSGHGCRSHRGRIAQSTDLSELDEQYRGATSHGLFHDGGDRAACLRGRPHHWRRADNRALRHPNSLRANYWAASSPAQ